MYLWSPMYLYIPDFTCVAVWVCGKLQCCLVPFPLAAVSALGLALEDLTIDFEALKIQSLEKSW